MPINKNQDLEFSNNKEALDFLNRIESLKNLTINDVIMSKQFDITLEYKEFLSDEIESFLYTSKHSTGTKFSKSTREEMKEIAEEARKNIEKMIKKIKTKLTCKKNNEKI